MIHLSRTWVWHLFLGGKENVSLAEALNQARLPIIDYKTCRQKKFWGDRVRDSMICAGFRDTEGTPAACQVRKLFNGEIYGGVPSSTIHTFYVALLPTGWLWRPSPVPGGTWPLGGPRDCELWSYWMHCGEQAQRLHSHRSLHPMDRGYTHQGLLLALNSHL